MSKISSFRQGQRNLYLCGIASTFNKNRHVENKLFPTSGLLAYVENAKNFV